MIALSTGRPRGMSVLALAALWLGGCSAGSGTVTVPTGVVRFEAGERASAKAVEGFVSAVGGAYDRAVASPASAASPAGVDLAGAGQRATAGPTSASCDSVAITYFNAQGQQQPAYDPATTTRIGAKGPCSTPQGIVTLDATADDAQASSATVLINGSAQGTYEGHDVRVVATNVRMTKQFCGAPAGGVLVATTDSLTATVRFDGTLTAQGTYTWNGIGVSFTVPLQACQ
jgi:hypothetical protein